MSNTFNSTQAKKNETFLSLLKRALETVAIEPLEIKKPMPIMTGWLAMNTLPKSFAINKACVLQDPNQQSRMIRCQEQNLFASSIQSLIKDGCSVKQLALSWQQDKLNFVLTEELTLRSIRYQDALLGLAKEQSNENPADLFAADFLIMTEVLTPLVQELVITFATEQ